MTERSIYDMRKSVKVLVVISSFLVSCLVFLLILQFKDITPFGNNTILVGDMKNQYLPFFQYYKTSLSDGRITTFQPELFLGGDYFGVFSYYLMSPFNLLLLLFPIKLMPEALSIITTLKIGMCGGCFALYLCCGPFKGKALRYVLLSSAYALMSWNMVCFQNVIWLDGIYILPLMALGVERFVKCHRSGFFIFTTFICILLNYYIAWFNVVFITIYFLARILLLDNHVKVKLSLFIRFCLSGIISAGLSAFFIIPVLFSLSGGKGQNDNYVMLKYKTADIISVVKMLSSQAYDGTYLDSAPYIFAGSVVIILCILYLLFCDDGAKPRMIFAFILLFYAISFTFYPLNALWHGLAKPAMIPSRFSYTFTFYMVFTAELGAESFENSKGFLKIKEKYTLLVKMLTYIIYIYSIGELFLNGSYIMGKILEEQAFSIKDEYVRITDTTSYLTENINFDNCYRTYDSQVFTLNDGMLYDYKMISGYSSAYPNNLSYFYKLVGMGVSRSYDCILRDSGLTPVMADILSVKNIIKNIDDKNYDIVGSNGYASLYLNYDAFTPFYVVSDECLYSDNVIDDGRLDMYDNPFVVQNGIVSDITGMELHPFSIVEFEQTNDEAGDYNIWHLSMHEEGMLWMYVPYITDSFDVPYEYYALVNDVRNIRFNVNNMPYCVCLGKYGENEDITIEIKEDGVLGTPLFAFMAEDDLQLFVTYMTDNMASDFEITETGVKGRIYSDFTNAVLFTYPYSVGLNVLVDGKVTDYNLYMDVFPVVNISEGMHTVELKYNIPGFGLGLSISAVFITTLLVYGIICSIRKKTV